MPIIDNFLLDNSRLDGTPGGFKYASGIVKSSDSNGRVIFTRSTMEEILLPSVVVSGLGFKPSIIFIGPFNASYNLSSTNGTYSKNIKHGAWPTYNWFWGTGATTAPELYRVVEGSIPVNDAYVTNGGFRFPYAYLTTDLAWEAYG
ncbi:hypothetical protein Q0V21_25015 [Paenibacillus sp. 11B]|uniref:hypothetical protein n=1 Tax=unclassified Paenibacillus TaxID=185978 RepID=UPI002656946B|nr:hypothetical protein [Paenibacillus sp. 11B]MDN8592011.1 hypothetical protein [Paenibacillus sp. 11B]